MKSLPDTCPAMSRVVVVGSINLDRTIRVEHLPSAGETVRAVSVTTGGGGKGANAAVASALAGAATSLIGCVGSDDAAAIALAELTDLGVDTSGVWATQASTGDATVFVDQDGQNCIVVVGGANEELTGAQVAEVLEGLTDVAVVLTNLEIPDAAVLAAAEVAAARGAVLIVNPAPARTLPERLLDLRPILTPNQDEVVRLSGAEAQAGALRLHRRTNALVVVTLGSEGALVAHDVFNGSLASGLARGFDALRATRFAVERASASTRHSGARARLPGVRLSPDRSAPGKARRDGRAG